MTHEDILNIFNSRFACKSFDPSKRVSDEDFQVLLEVARLSPTSFGFEPFNILVLEDKDLRCKIYPHAWGAQKSLDGASHFVIFLARKRQDLEWGSHYLEHILIDVKQMPEDIYNVYGPAYKNFATNDFKTMESERAAFDWAAKQAYIALGNMLTTASALEIDSCPIEGFVPAKIDEILGDEAGLYDTNHFGVAVMASFGYRLGEPHRGKTRRSLEEIVSWK